MRNLWSPGARSAAARLGPVAAFVLFSLLLLWRPLFAGEAFFWGTPLLQFVPWQRMAARMWRSASLPLWNPLVGCGAPLAANYQTAAFYPLNALHLLLPAETALSWTTALHLALTGWAMYRWGRCVGLDRFPAFVGALTLEGSGFLAARAALFPSMALTFPWLAVWLWRGERLAQRSRSRDALWLGLALGLGLLAGHAQIACYGGLLLAAYLIFRSVQEVRKEGWTRRTDTSSVARRASFFTLRVPRLWLLIALSLLIGVGLASVQLLPTAELMAQSQRSTGVGYDFAMTYSFWPWRLITLFAPKFFGDPGQGDYWGYAAHWEDALYVGLLPLLLAIGALLGRRREARGEKRNPGHQKTRLAVYVSRIGSRIFDRRPTISFWVIGALVSLLLALGRNTPAFPFLFRHVPGFDMFQAPARWLAVATVALSALAALGAQRWPAGRLGRSRGALWAVVGAALLIGGLAAPGVVPGIPGTFSPATARLGGTLILAGVLALLRRSAAWWRVATGAFIAFDLLLFGWPLTPTTDRSLYHGSTETAAALGDEPAPVRVYWPTDPSQRDRDLAEYRVKFNYLSFDDFGPRDVDHWWGMREALLPNVGMLEGVASANNFDPLLVGRYAELLSGALDSPGLLRVMGVTHVASDRTEPGWEPVHTTDSVTLYRLPDAPGRAWVAPAARQVAPDEMLAALTDPAFDPTAEVLLERGAQSPARGAQSTARSAPYSASGAQYQVTLQDTFNGVKIHAVLEAPGYLALADTWYPGWRATVDGKRVEILRANHALRAVWLEEGEHTVEMAYRPTVALVGGAVSLTSLAGLSAGLIWSRRKRDARAGRG